MRTPNTSTPQEFARSTVCEQVKSVLAKEMTASQREHQIANIYAAAWRSRTQQAPDLALHIEQLAETKMRSK